MSYFTERSKSFEVLVCWAHALSSYLGLITVVLRWDVSRWLPLWLPGPEHRCDRKPISFTFLSYPSAAGRKQSRESQRVLIQTTSFVLSSARMIYKQENNNHEKDINIWCPGRPGSQSTGVVTFSVSVTKGRRRRDRRTLKLSAFLIRSDGDKARSLAHPYVRSAVPENTCVSSCKVVPPRISRSLTVTLPQSFWVSTSSKNRLQ